MANFPDLVRGYDRYYPAIYIERQDWRRHDDEYCFFVDAGHNVYHISSHDGRLVESWMSWKELMNTRQYARHCPPLLALPAGA